MLLRSKILKTQVYLLAAFVSLLAKESFAMDPYITDIYKSYCQACHTAPGSGAPQAFKQVEWKKILKPGLDQVVNNAILGKGNMPSLGGCQECTYEDIEELIIYMSTPAGDKKDKEQANEK